jgi:hypothetical protein
MMITEDRLRARLAQYGCPSPFGHIDWLQAGRGRWLSSCHAITKAKNEVPPQRCETCPQTPVMWVEYFGGRRIPQCSRCVALGLADDAIGYEPNPHRGGAPRREGR